MLGFFFPGATVATKPGPGVTLPTASVGGAA
jgi:hypothetical protein